MKKNWVIFLSSILLAVSSLFVPSFNRDKMTAHAITNTDTTSFVEVGELWDDSTQNFSGANFESLLNYIGGKTYTQFGDIKTMSEGGFDVSEMRQNALTGASGTALKSNTQDIVVTLGGLKWQVVYLSQEKNGDPILTLWLSSNTQEAFNGKTATHSGYRFYNSAMFSKWSAWQLASATEADAYPGNMYGASYIRSVALNNGGYYSTAVDTLSSYVQKTTENVFALYTMEQFGLTDYLVVPRDVPYQTTQRYPDVYGSGKDLPNEAAAELATENWTSATYDYTSKDKYFVWANDYLWLPSITEVGTDAGTGIWKTTTEQRKIADGTSANPTSGLYNYSLLRTALASDPTSVRVIMQTGSGLQQNYLTDYVRAVRPALHLNLKDVYENVLEQTAEDYSTIYLDPSCGDDTQKGLTRYSAVKSLAKAEELVTEDGTVVVMNTISVLEDTTIGENKSYTLKRFYRNDDANFTGNLMQVGTYVSAGSANNVRVNLHIKNVIIDGNSRKNGTITGQKTFWATANAFNAQGTLILSENADVYFSGNGGLKDNYYRNGGNLSNKGAGIYLRNESTLTISGGIFENLSAYGAGGAVYSETTGEIIIRDGTFIKNSSQSAGAVIHSDNADITVYDGTFGYWVDDDGDGAIDYNSAKEDFGNYCQHSAGVFYANKLTIYDGRFENNTSNSAEGSVGSVKSLYVYGGEFLYGRSNYTGYVTVEGSAFRAENAYIYGGLFANNIAAVRGGALSIEVYAEIKNANFTENKALVGGAIFAYSGSTINIENCVFDTNKATNKMTISSTDYYGGGAIYAAGCNVTIRDSKFYNNTAVLKGGVIVTDETSVLNCYNSYFEGNQANKEGTSGVEGIGGVGSHQNLLEKKINYYNCDFYNNYARSQGGALANAIVYDCHFEGNNCENDGGAIEGGSAYNSSFVNNTTYNRGGAIALAQDIDSCYFSGNSTSQSEGGAVYVFQNVLNSTFEGNTAKTYGGALAWLSNNYESVVVKNSTFEKNFAQQGGAIYLTGNKKASIENCTITNNVASSLGGGVYVADGVTFSLNNPSSMKYMFIDNNFVATTLETLEEDANGDLIGTNQNNLYIVSPTTAVFRTIPLLTNLMEGSKIGVSSNAMYNNAQIFGLTGANENYDQFTANAVFIDNQPDYVAYNENLTSGINKTGVGIFVKNIGSDLVQYTANNAYFAYDGTYHTIDINVLSHTEYTIWYSTEENGTYTTEPVTVSEPGSVKTVWFYIETINGNSEKESRQVTIDRLELQYDVSEIDVNLYLQLSLTNGTDITDFVKGVIYDIEGNPVVCSFVWADGTLSTGTTTHGLTKKVDIIPYNTERYKPCEDVVLTLSIAYENLYFKDNAFYPTSDLPAKYKVTTSQCPLDKIIAFVEDGGKIVFLSAYSVATTMTLTTEKQIYFERNEEYKGAIISITSAGKLTIGNLSSAGKFVFDGKKVEATSALITNAGELNVYGNVTFKDAYNYSTTLDGGAILNTETLNIDGAYFENNKTKSNGGAICSTSTLTLKNTTIYGGYAVKGGAGLYISGIVAIDNCKIENNYGWNFNATKTCSGVGLYIAGPSTKVDISNSVITGNQYDTTMVDKFYGGGLRVENGATVNIKDSTISNNLAYNGAGVYVGSNAKLNITRTHVNQNIASYRGGGFYTVAGSQTHFISGTINNNVSIIGYGGYAGAGVYVFSGYFAFGEDETYSSTIAGNNTSKNGVYGEAVYVSEGGVFEFFSGNIQKQGGTDTDYSILHIGVGGIAKLHKGEIFKEPFYISAAEIYVVGTLYVSSNFRIPNRVYVSGILSNGSSTVGKIYLMDDFSNYYTNVEIFINEKTDVPNCAIIMADAENYIPANKEEWEIIYNAITFTSKVSGFTTNKAYIYDKANNMFIIYIDTGIVNSQTIYFDPNASSAGSGTESSPVNSWQLVLENTTPGATVYLISTWKILIDTTINGGGRTLKRYYNASSPFTTAMFKISAANVDLTIYDLIIDGNRTKNDTVTDMASYLASTEGIINCTNYSADINLFNNTYVMNGHTTTGTMSAGIMIKLDVTNLTVNLNIGNSYIVNNSINNNTAYARGAGILIQQDTNTNKIIDFNMYVSNTTFSGNSIKTTTYNDSHIGGSAFALYTGYNHYSGRDYDVTFEGCTIVENHIESSTNSYNFGGALMFMGYPDTKGVNNPLKLTIVDCEFRENSNICYGSNSNTTTSSSAVGIRYNSGHLDLNIKDCSFIDNRSTSGASLTITPNDDRATTTINVENLVFKNKYRTWREFVLNAVEATEVNIKNVYVETQAQHSVMIYNTNSQVNISDMEIYGGHYGLYIQSTDADFVVKNVKIQNTTYRAIDVLYTNSIRFENVDIVNPGEHGVVIRGSKNYFVSYRNINITGATSYAINQEGHSEKRVTTLENVNIDNCYQGMNIQGITSGTNIELEQVYAKDVSITNIYQYALYLRRINFVGDNVSIKEVQGTAVHFQGANKFSDVSIDGANEGIYVGLDSVGLDSIIDNVYITNCRGNSILIGGTTSATTSGNITITNTTVENSYSGIYHRYLLNNSTLTIGENVVLKNNRRGFILDLQTNDLGSNDFGNFTINIDGAKFNNNYECGMWLRASNYGTSNPTIFNLNVRNTEIKDNSLYGIYVQEVGLQYNANAITNNINFEDSMVVSGSRYGLYISTSSANKGLTINGGTFTGNQTGIFGNYRVDISSGVFKDNINIDVLARKIYLSGDPLIGYLAYKPTASEASVYITGNVTTTTKIELIHTDDTLTAGHIAVQTDGTYSPTSSVWNRIAGLFTSKGATFTIGTNILTIATIKDVASTVNTYYFDPSNRTTKATASNDGKTVDTPFLNWSQVTATTKTDTSKDIVIYMLSTFNVSTDIDGGNRVFKFYISPTNNNFYFNGSTNPGGAYMFSIKANVTVKNIIVDGNANKDGSSFHYQYPTKSSGGYNYHSNMRIAEVNTADITVNFESFSIRNYVGWVYEIVYIKDATVNVKGGDFRNITGYSNSYYVFRAYNSSVLNIEDSYFYQTSGAANLSNNSHGKFTNCTVEDNSAYTFANESNNLGKMTIENCTFTSVLMPTSEKVIYCGQNTESEISGCYFKGYSTAVWILSGSTVSVTGCEMYNISECAIDIRETNTQVNLDNITIARAQYAVRWLSTNTTLVASNLNISYCYNGIGHYNHNATKAGSDIYVENSIIDQCIYGISIFYPTATDGTTHSTHTFKNVTVTNCSYAGLYTSTYTALSDVIVEDCSFKNNYINIYAREIDMTIKGETVINGGRYGIYLFNQYGNDIVVENVLIKNQYQAAIYSENYFQSSSIGYTTSKFTMNGGLIDNNHRVLQQASSASGKMNFYFNGGTITNNNGVNSLSSTNTYSSIGNDTVMYFYNANVYFSGSIVIECGIWAPAKTLSSGTYASNSVYIGELTSEAYLRFYTGATNAISGLCLAQNDPSVTFTASTWANVLQRVSIDHWKVDSFTDGTIYALITGDKDYTNGIIPHKDKVLFFDPANTTGKASDNNSGLYYNYPLLTLEGVKKLASDGVTIYYISTFVISTDTIIDGYGLTLTRYSSSTIQLTGPFIQVSSAVEVTIKNLIIDGNGNASTGANRVIYASVANAEIYVENCEFRNMSSVLNGAVIYTDKLAKVNVQNTKFINNRTTVAGGAIYVTGDLTVNNCHFENNRSNDNSLGGGAIHIYVNKQEFTVVIENSTFFNNYAKSYGGAIRCYEAENATYYSYLTIRNCDFYYNRADNYAAAVLARSKDTVISGCYFEGNTCTSTVSSYYGGIVDYCGPVDCYLEDCTFKHNYSRTRGLVNFQNTGSSYVSNCVFDSNTGEKSGLLCFVEESGSYSTTRTPVRNVYVDGVVFKNSTTSSDGGNAIRLESDYETEGEFIFENIDIINYSVQSSILNLRAKGKQIAVRNLYCENISTFGAGILIRQYETYPVDVYYENITFKNCSSYYTGTTADTQYGLLFANNNGTINVDGVYAENISFYEPMMIFRSTSSSYTATVNLNDIHVKDTVLKRNNNAGYQSSIVTSSFGGAILRTSYANVNLTNSTFENNDVLSNPATGIVSITYGSADVDNVQLINNRISGQVFRVVDSERGSTAALTNIVAKGNKFAGTSGSASYGGGITVVGLDTASIDNVIVENNTAYNAGGGIYLEDTIVYLRNSVIKNNETISATSTIDGSLYQTGTIDPVINATIYGGGGIAVAGGKLIASNIEVVGNKSAGLAGGIAAYAPIEITDSIISNNQATNGGGIVTTMDAFIEGVEIVNNTATEAGGVLFASHLTLTNSEVVGNLATSGNGGGLSGYTNSTISNLTIDNVLLKDNLAQGDGGAIYFGNSQGLFIPRNLEIIANTSYGEGTAIYSAVNFDLINSKVSGNYIRKNSLIYINDVIKTTFKDNVISGNYGFGDDATLFKFITTTVDGIPTINITNTSIYGNMTEKQALILIVNDIYLSVTDSSIYGNVNKGNDGMGGVINIQEGTLSLEKTVLQNNYAINGSAIYMNTGSNLLFVDSIITGHSSGMGNNYCKNGVVYIATGAQAKFDGGVITQNKVSEANGVIYSDGVLNITKTEIYDNLSLNGMVYNAANGFLSLEDINIHDNIVRNGGGVYNLGTAHFINGVITRNIATNDESVTPVVYGCGGGVYNAENGIFTMSGGQIVNNTAGNGGGIYNNSFLILNGGEIKNNTVTHSGGGVYNDVDGNFALNDGLIAYNAPKAGVVNVTGFGITTAGKMNMVGGSISNNYVDSTSASFANSKGGAIYATNGSHTQISGGTILDNLAESGAGVYFDAGSIADIKYITIDNVTRTTSSKTYGRAIFTNLSTINLYEVVFKATGSVTSNNNDGVIYALNSQVNIKGCEFVNNNENIGIVYAKEGLLNIEKTMFKNNKTKFDANSQAIVYVEGVSSLTIKDSNFVSNETSGDGGAVKIVITNTKFEGLIDNNFFSGNKATKDGGAIAISSAVTAKVDSYLLISNSIFESNISERNGGALAINGGAGLTLSLLNNVFGGVGVGNSATRNGGAIYVANNETSPISIVVNGQIDVNNNVASGNGGGIYTELDYPGNTAESYYNFYFNSGVLANITNNTDSNGASNLYVLKTTNLKMLLTGVKAGSSIGVTLADAGGADLSVGDIVLASYKDDIPLTTRDFESFFFDNASYNIKLDADKNAIVIAEPSSSEMVVVASDKVFSMDGTYKTVTAEDIKVTGATDVTITFATAENGIYSETAPKYLARGTYTIWYKVVDNTGANEDVVGSLTLKITGKVLIIEENPIAYLNKGETLDKATFRGGLVTNEASAVAGIWQFENLNTKPTDTKTKYKVIFKPYNTVIYENVASVYITVSISFRTVYYFNDGTTKGFFNDRLHTQPTGITSLPEMVDSLQNMGIIYFMSTYIVGENGTEEVLTTDKKIFMARYATFTAGPIIKVPQNATPIKFTLGGGIGEFSFHARYGYSTQYGETSLFENYGIMTINSNVIMRGFTNRSGGASLFTNYESGVLYLNGCELFNNNSNNTSDTTLDSKGGVLDNRGTTYINGGDFRLNKSNGSKKALGGFAYNTGLLVINSGLFVRNIAKQGGLIYSNGGSVVLSGGDIIGNYAYEGAGGAVFATNGAQINVNGARIISNISTSGGAGIHSESSNIFVNGGEVKFNIVSNVPLFEENKQVENNEQSVVLGICYAIVLISIAIFSVYFYLPKKKKFKINKSK